MKKRLNLLALICLAVFTFHSCVENDPDIVNLPSKDVDFYYTSQTINYVILEEISFVNISVIGSSYEWDFGDGKKSTEKNPVHQYEEPGSYTVKLKVDGTYSTSKKLLISDIVPTIRVTNGQGAIYKQTKVTLTPYVDNPEKADVIYNWTFPMGTQGEGIGPDGRISLTEATPITAVFNQFGTMNVTLQVTLGTKNLDPITQKVNINYDKPAKTLYYAAKGGNIMAKKLVGGIDSEAGVPFDTQYSSGKHSLTLLHSGDLLYVLDAGSKIGFVANSAGLGDGEIFVINSEWNRRETVIENKGGDSYLDFFYGYIDEQAGQLHFLDRREGIRWIPLTTRNTKFDEEIYTYWVTNNRLGYYGNGIGFGNVNGPLFKHDGVWNWAKNSNGMGLFRFTDSDVDQAAIPDAGAIMTSRKIRGAAVDEVNGHIYFSDNGLYRIIRSDLATGSNSRMIDDSTTDSEGGGTEALFVTGMALDLEEGYLYWAYRGPSPEGDPNEYYATNPLARSGIKRIKLDDITTDMDENKSKIEYFVEGVEAYGLTIDHTAR